MKRNPEVTDSQILQALKDFKKTGKTANEYQLLHYCKKNMFGLWSIGKVQKAVKRLESRNKIRTKGVILGGRLCQVVELL